MSAAPFGQLTLFTITVSSNEDHGLAYEAAFAVVVELLDLLKRALCAVVQLKLKR